MLQIETNGTTTKGVGTFVVVQKEAAPIKRGGFKLILF